MTPRENVTLKQNINKAKAFMNFYYPTLYYLSFNYPTSNLLSQLHLNLLYKSFYCPTVLLSKLIVTPLPGSDNRGSPVLCGLSDRKCSIFVFIN